MNGHRTLGNPRSRQLFLLRGDIVIPWECGLEGLVRLVEPADLQDYIQFTDILYFPGSYRYTVNSHRSVLS